MRAAPLVVGKGPTAPSGAEWAGLTLPKGPYGLWRRTPSSGQRCHQVQKCRHAKVSTPKPVQVTLKPSSFVESCRGLKSTGRALADENHSPLPLGRGDVVDHLRATVGMSLSALPTAPTVCVGSPLNATQNTESSDAKVSETVHPQLMTVCAHSHFTRAKCRAGDWSLGIGHMRVKGVEVLTHHVG